MEKYNFIHIGKCGGSSVVQFLKKNNIYHNKVHRTLIFNEKNRKINKLFSIKNYLILVRNPIARFVSAFNWTKELYKREKIPYKFTQEYKSANDFALDLFKKKVKKKKFKGKCYDHFDKDINYYTKDILKLYNNGQKNVKNIKIIRTEYLEDDLNNYFKTNTKILHVHKNSNYDKYLSKEAIYNIKLWYKKDYKCLFKMYEMDLISKKYYNECLNYKYIKE